MDITFEPSWKSVLAPEFEKPYFRQLVDFVKREYSAAPCYPPEHEIFAAFDQCPFDKLEVVLIGQDPYHGAKQAHGLCFSVNDGIAFPPSLRNIFGEIRQDLGKPVPQTGNLGHWARQGVLLLNATLSVREGLAASHQGKGWETFTDAVIKTVSNQKDHVVFLLWGGHAKKKASLIDSRKHLILESGHPSPLSANKGYWFGNRHFSRANEWLMAKGKSKIDW